MDAEKFKKLYEEASPELPNSRMRFLTEMNVMQEKIRGDKECNHIKTVVIEELSEMIQALTKSIRGTDNRLNVLEELVDVTISVQYIIEIFDISVEEFNKAANVKLNRLERKMKEEGHYE